MRKQCRDRRWLALGLVMLALAVRALVPQGFMPVAAGHVLQVQICADASGLDHARQIIVPDRASGQSGPGHPDAPDHHKACAFAGHAMPLLGGVDALLLAAALLFAMVLALAPAAPTIARRPARLRPPLRAPPALS